MDYLNNFRKKSITHFCEIVPLCMGLLMYNMTDTFGPCWELKCNLLSLHLKTFTFLVSALSLLSLSTPSLRWPLGCSVTAEAAAVVDSDPAGSQRRRLAWRLSHISLSIVSGRQGQAHRVLKNELISPSLCPPLCVCPASVCWGEAGVSEPTFAGFCRSPILSTLWDYETAGGDILSEV